MSDSSLHLSQTAADGVMTALAPPIPSRLSEPIWRLLFAAVFAAAGALSFAVVVIFGAPVSDPAAARDAGRAQAATPLH